MHRPSRTYSELINDDMEKNKRASGEGNNLVQKKKR